MGNSQLNSNIADLKNASDYIFKNTKNTKNTKEQTHKNKTTKHSNKIKTITSITKTPLGRCSKAHQARSSNETTHLHGTSMFASICLILFICYNSLPNSLPNILFSFVILCFFNCCLLCLTTCQR